MSALLATAGVDAWEECQGRTHSEVAVRLLQLVQPEANRGQLAAMSIGSRDRLLLEYRSETFGTDFELQTVCPNCGERLELQASSDEFHRPRDAEREVHEWTDGQYRVKFRLPSSQDVVIASRGAEMDEQYRRLWRRCTSTTLEGHEIDPDLVPDEVRRRVEEAMLELDAQAVVAMRLDCPECGNAWDADFDVVPVLWAEFDRLVRQRLHDVHRLAETYGWSEETILNLSPARRQFYLDLL